MSGTLYLVGTPIGNLEDMTPRAVRILGEVDLIAVEDTRRTIKLLNHFGIKKPMLSYYRHNERGRTDELLSRLEAGESIALVSDAGLPGISDPGETLVQAAIGTGVPVIPIPGPSACLLALSVSGLPSSSFLFLGFLPVRGGERRSALERIGAEERTMVLYEAPHRLLKTLSDLAKTLGGERRVFVAREMTKMHEEYWRGDLAGALARFGEDEVKGEITLAVGGRPPVNERPSLKQACARVAELRAKGATLSDAVRSTAQELGLPRNSLYRAVTEHEKKVREDQQNLP